MPLHPFALQIDGEEGGYNSHFSTGGLALYTAVYLVLMSIGAGLAIPGGLFMPSIVVRARSYMSTRRRNTYIVKMRMQILGQPLRRVCCDTRHLFPISCQTYMLWAASISLLCPALQLGAAWGGLWGILVRVSWGE